MLTLKFRKIEKLTRKNASKFVNLIYLYIIGRRFAFMICKVARIDPTKRAGLLS